jgi:hypothetical protein
MIIALSSIAVRWVVLLVAIWIVLKCVEYGFIPE